MGQSADGWFVRCGLVLAGGSGQRVRSLVYRMRGDALPKQYVRFAGPQSLLEQTFDRVERLIPPERVFTIAGHSHLQFPEANEQLSRRLPGTVVLQPENKETGPGVLLPLLHIVNRHPDAVVGVFPSDHAVDQEGLFMGYVDLAFRTVERHPSSVVVLGVQPQHAERDYGYIVPATGSAATPLPGMQRVLAFVEKPDEPLAGELIERGGLWNTMVMVFRPKTLLDVVARVAPALRDAFDRIRWAVGTPQEERVVEDVYRELEPTNFSRTVLHAMAGRRSPTLYVLPVRGVSWNDWGSEKRILTSLTPPNGHWGTGPQPAAQLFADAG